MNNENQNFQQPAPVNTGKGLSVAGLVLGIVSAVFAWFGWGAIVALACGIIGIVCASMGQKKAKAAGTKSGIATAGLVVSIIGTCLAGIGFLSCVLCAGCLAAAGAGAGF